MSAAAYIPLLIGNPASYTETLTSPCHCPLEDYTLQYAGFNTVTALSIEH
jgi:hypothetical protein